MSTQDSLAYLTSHLNPEQLAAASYVEGASLILAGAGSGKTRTLTYKIVHLLRGYGVSPQHILAVTFTNKAAQEMRERIAQILEDIKWNAWAAKPSDDFDALIGSASSSTHPPHITPQSLARVGTFHSIFLKILKQDIAHLDLGYTTNFGVYDADDSVKLIKDSIKKMKMQEQVEYQEAKRVISSWKNSWRMPEQAGYHAETKQEERIRNLYKVYQKALQDANALDFDDLLLLPKILFEKAPSILQKWQERFKYVLVDEAQDTNTIQFELMKMLTGSTWNITFIGDDYQSIYRWRGAVMENFLQLQMQRPNIKTFKLETNYRSLPHIVEAGNAIIKQNTKQYDKHMTPHRTGDQQIRLFTFADEADEAVQLITLIKRLQEETGKSRSDFTILYRTNAQSTPFEQVLITDWIPYKVVGAFRFFERKEVKDILSYLKYLQNPQDIIALQRIINTPQRELGPTTIWRLEEAAQRAGVTFNQIALNVDSVAHDLTAAQTTKLKHFAALIKSMLDGVELFTPQQLIEQIVQSIRYKDYLIKQDGNEQAEERMQNIGQLINMASKFEQPGAESLASFLEEVSLMTSVDDESENNQGIRLMTVHASKGLEFPYVFLTGLEENIFPLPKAKFDDDELEEERRGMYVAITRAKDHLFISHATSRMQRGQLKYNPPSRFIGELPSHLIKPYDLSTDTRYQKKWPSFDEGDRVSHKLFGSGSILEVRDSVVIIQFDNPKIWLRKMEGKFLTKV